jgi:hypothetical protein
MAVSSAPATRHDLREHLPLISILRLPEPSPRSSSHFQQSAPHQKRKPSVKSGALSDSFNISKKRVD